ncbi:MAG TPA: LLM class F420-dependent oxidoreductase [Pseudomonadales bacterium]|nr:LLM class F420-dependent oxidoreductase [Pseudomonadales bacterium]
MVTTHMGNKSTMKLGFSLPNNQGIAHVNDLVTLAVEAESLGYHSVWVSEHLFHATYVASRLGDAPYHEALTILTAVAGATSKVRLGTSVLVLPWHHPVQLAKRVASLDDYSGGRVSLGVGVAQTEDEFENLGVSFTHRGRIADEMLTAMKILWTEKYPIFNGKYFNFNDLQFEPKPVQKPYPPLLIGGTSRRAIERVVEHGDGWHALSQSPQDIAPVVNELRQRRSDTIDVSVRSMTTIMDRSWDRPVEERVTMKGTLEELAAMLQAYEHAGVDEVVLDSHSRDVETNRHILRSFADLNG